MSLINQMLKDLAKQKPSKPLQHTSTLQGLSSVAIARTFPRWLTIALAIGILIILSAGILFFIKLNSGVNVSRAAMVQAPTIEPVVVEIENKLVDSDAINHTPDQSTRSAEKDITEVETVQVVETRAPVVKKVMRPLSIEQQVANQYQTAIAHLRVGDQPSAISELKVLLSQYPHYAPARESLAAIYMSQKNITQAQHLLTEGLTHNPNYSPFAKMSAAILLQQGQFEQALQQLVQAKPNIQDDPDYYALMASLHQQLGQPQLAGSLYQQLVQIDSSNGVWWMGLGIALERLNRPNNAANAYQRAMHSQSLDDQVHAYVMSRLNSLMG